jgi:acyl CoA:acetate/3-ketoacid CoA transferase alpha subunit
MKKDPNGVPIYREHGWNKVTLAAVGTVEHVSKSGSEIRLLGFEHRFRPMGLIHQIRDSFSRSLVGTRVRVGLNSMGAVVWYEIISEGY